ncbi:MAG: hypothetical protein LUG18_14030 [Candidatus Azobacteroides sp.]|nr:hypothetical protein [Candidatus Azobacteroides sp.]
MRTFFLYLGGLVLVRLLVVTACAQSDSPYHISMEGLLPGNLDLLEQLPSSGTSPDSLMREKNKEMPFSYKIKLLNEAYEDYFQNIYPVVNLNLRYTLYGKEYRYETSLDRAAFIYDTYRYSFMYDHGYFGPALYPTGGRYIPKTIYRDALYPWQNALKSQHHTYKGLYLITNFVYPYP